MNMRKTRRSWIPSALGLSSLLTISSGAAAQVTVVDAGSDRLVSAPSTTAVHSSSPVASTFSTSIADDNGDSLQLHTARVAALTNLSQSLRSACTNQLPDIDKVALERAVGRALALRRGLVDLEQREKRLRLESAQKPNDGRIRAELASVVQSKQRLLEAATREVSGKLSEPARNLGTLRSSLCSELCTRGDKSPSAVDLCAFSSPALAHAAVISDEASVRGLATYIQHRFDALRLVLPSKQSVTFAEMAQADPGLSPIFAVADASSRVLDEEHTGLDVASFTLGALDVGVRAVATLLLDRAKRESLVWLSRRLHEDICGGVKPGDGYDELRAYWFPTTCSLGGGSMGFSPYGNTDWIRTLRGALAADISSWHGAALGLQFGATLWADAHLASSVFSCAPSTGETVLCTGQGPERIACETKRKNQNTCRAVHDVRLSGANLGRDFASGANASLALYNFASDIDRINVDMESGADGRRFFSDRLELLACAAAIPYVFQEYGNMVRQARPGRTEESKAILLAALTSAPACFSVLGQGYSRNICQGFSETTAAEAASVCPKAAADKAIDERLRPISATMAAGSIEKLTTILRWSRMVEHSAVDLSTRWFAIVDAFRVYRSAVDDMTKGVAQTAIPAAPLDLSGLSGTSRVDDVFRAAGAYAESSARLAERIPKLRVARAGLVLARASMDVARAFLDGTERTLGRQPTSNLFESWYEQAPNDAHSETQALLQALFPGFGKTAALSSSALRELFVGTSADMRRLSEAIDTIDAVLAEDWNRVVARVMASMQVDASRACSSKRCQDACAQGEGACGAVAQMGRYSGLFSVLAFESDPDRVVAAIDAAASPVGGYRRKNVPGAWTISLGSFAGLSGGTEFRFGTYGGRKETGQVAYLAAPTLTLPVGIDFARGFGTHNLGVFVSAVDPAAYLQYDVTAGATLPGAQFVTALAPGAWLHASILDSPFTLGLYGVFRPGLRADTSALTIPGAHALQFGFSAAVDVTLFDLFSSSSGAFRK